MASFTALLLGCGLTVRAAAEPPEPVRILLLGDSVTHGTTGDWTWRYRLAEQLTAQGVRFDLVGPEDDLFPGSVDYVDPAFDREHAAAWGMAASAPAFDVGELVARHQPDVVIEMLGVNDLVWQEHPPETVVGRVATMTEEIRSVDPDVHVLVSEVPATWFPGVPEFNELLADFAGRADTTSTRTVLVDADRDYTKGLHTYGLAHPSSRGEQSLAFAVLDALADIGVGSGAPGVAPELPLGPRLVPTLVGHTGQDSVRLEWADNRGADRQFVWWRDVTEGSAYARFADPVLGTATTVEGLSPSHRYAFRLQPAKGVHLAAEDVRSNELELSMPSPAEPAGQLPGPSVPPTALPVAPHLPLAPDSSRPRLRATLLPDGVVRLRWRHVSGGPVEIQARLSGSWLTWRKVSGSRHTLVTKRFTHRSRTVLRLRDSSGLISKVVAIRIR